jgi:hypothetical protein
MPRTPEEMREYQAERRRKLREVEAAKAILAVESTLGNDRSGQLRKASRLERKKPAPSERAVLGSNDFSSEIQAMSQSARDTILNRINHPPKP